MEIAIQAPEVAADPDDAGLATALQALTASEFQAYKFTVDQKLPQVSAHFEAGLFSLFLNGYTMLDILAQNPGITLGQICRARVDGRWDRRRQEYRDQLLFQTQARLEQTVMESYQFLSAQLAVVHRREGNKLRAFLQSNDEKDLGDFTIQGWRAYKDAVDTLKALGGGRGPEIVPPTPPPEKTVAQVAEPVDAKKVIAKQVEVRRAQLEQQAGGVKK